MKKYTLFFFVFAFVLGFLGLFTFNVNSASADYLPGCRSEQGFSTTTGQPCNVYFPPGCTSVQGYSRTTGVKCDSLINTSFPPGCTSTQGYSPLTGLKCNTAIDPSLPPGCTSTQGFSPTTGQPCSVSALPDLIIQEVSSSRLGSATFANTDAIDFYVDIKNTGADVSGSFAVSMKGNPDAQYTTGWLAGNGFEGLIMSGETKSILIGSYLMPSNRDYADTPVFTVDSKDEINESNETNNILQQYIRIPSTTRPTYPPGCTSNSGYSSTTGQPCDGSNSQFPVISGVSGPQSLKVNEQGTWSITASDKNGGNLSHSVVWGGRV